MNDSKVQLTFDGGIKRFTTDCCALGQLSLSNTHTKQQILSVLNTIRQESAHNWMGNSKVGGDRAIFTITTPNEQQLAATLAEIGFKEIAEFPRRNGYPEGLLKLWLIVL